MIVLEVSVKVALAVALESVGVVTEFKAGVDAPPGKTPPPSSWPPTCANTKMLSEPALLTSTLSCPPGLVTTSIVLGAAGTPPCACKIDSTARALPCGSNRSTTPPAKATTTWPLARACAATTCWPEYTTSEPPDGFTGRTAPGPTRRHGVAQTAIARERRRLDHCAAEIEQRIADPVVEEAAADARAARSRCRCRR